MTIKDIAKLAGVSVATVSRVLNNDPKVGDASLKKVLKIIKENNYIPNNAGRNLRKSKSEMILVLLPTLSNPFYSKILRGIEERAAELGYGVLLSVTHIDLDLEKKYLKILQTKQADGAISLFSMLSAGELNDISSKLPFVQCCEYTQGAKLSHVSIDNYKAAYAATEYFIRNGHEKIGMISGRFYKSSEADRERGYKDALLDHGIEYDESYIVKSDYKPTTGKLLCERLLNMTPAPTAILAVSDMLAIGALRHLKERGLRAGDDIEVIGFDNASITKVYDPTVSTVAQPRYELGRIAVDLLIEKIDDINSLNKGITLSHELLLRESTKKQNKNGGLL